MNRLVLSGLVLASVSSCSGDTATPNPTPTRLAFLTQPSGTEALVTLAPVPRVAVLDQFGDLFPTNLHAVTLALGQSSSGATLLGTTTVYAVGGVASFGDLRIDNPGSGYTLVASAPGLAGAATAVFDIGPSRAAALTFETEPGAAEGQVAFAPDVRVAVRDAAGGLVSDGIRDITIRLAANPGGATLVGTTSVGTVGGVATFNDLSLERPGDGYVLEALTAGLPPVSSAGFSVRLTFAQASVGGAHSCGTTVAGFVYCWGANGETQLGDGTFSNRSTPTPLPGRLSFAQLSAGREHNCAVATSTSTYCWGAAGQGRLGAGVPAFGLLRLTFGVTFTQVVAGTFHSCALGVEGRLYCWGSNSFGELGDPAAAGGTQLVGVAPNLLRFLQVSAGDHHTCAITQGQELYCWGDNAYGQLGDGTNQPRPTPTAVAGGLRFVQVSASFAHTCAVSTAARAYCWGVGGFGRLGDGTNLTRLVPTEVAGGLRFTGVSAGFSHTCGVTTDHVAYCWGFGALGDGTTAERNAPVPVTGNLEFLLIVAGGHTCGITTSQVLYCWGGNLFGQLGDGTSVERLTPARVVQ